MSKIYIKNNDPIGKDYYLLELEAPDIIEQALPGRFLNLKLSSDNNYDPLLRRPLSIHDINPTTNSIYLLYRIVGRGTQILSTYTTGHTLDILGPLGTGFSTNKSKENILVIGGGMGIAPLYYLCKKLSENNKLTIVLGTNNMRNLEYFSDIFKELEQEIYLTTIDGSMGFKGNVVELCNKKINVSEYDYIYTCGPEPMLKPVQDMAIQNEIDGEVSMEERMGCGIGLCLSCVCDTKTGNQRVCKEGPVL
ncbi:MAG: dihydroorotate dehydrogenase electron transfer subunit, partial [Halanaerobiales bacterium]